MSAFVTLLNLTFWSQRMTILLLFDILQSNQWKGTCVLEVYKRKKMIELCWILKKTFKCCPHAVIIPSKNCVFSNAEYCQMTLGRNWIFVLGRTLALTLSVCDCHTHKLPWSARWWPSPTSGGWMTHGQHLLLWLPLSFYSVLWESSSLSSPTPG